MTARMHAGTSIALSLLVTCGMASAMVQVTSPPYCSTVQGDTPIAVSAAGFKTVTVRCWKQGDGFGTDSTVGQVTMDAEGQGTIVFPADEYPHGPITLTLTGESRAVPKKEGDEVHAGTLVVDGALRVRATRTGDDTQLARITQLVEHALQVTGRVVLVALSGYGLRLPAGSIAK